MMECPNCLSQYPEEHLRTARRGTTILSMVLNTVGAWTIKRISSRMVCSNEGCAQATALGSSSQQIYPRVGMRSELQEAKSRDAGNCSTCSPFEMTSLKPLRWPLINLLSGAVKS